jgi:lipopolysaccharide export system permease protein
MNALFRYILRQTVAPIVFFTLVLTLVVWLTQSLDLLDLVLNRGQSLATFLSLSTLVLPFLLVNILPFAVFVAILYALNRFFADSEIVVMWSAGVSRWRVLAPIMTAALLITALAYVLNLFAMPAGYRAMKDRIYDIRGDLATVFIREGTFSTPIRGLTIFLREAPPGGDLRGLFVHDNRNPQEPVTYMAERGIFLRTAAGPRLVMESGTIQRIAPGEAAGAGISYIQFDRYTFDLAPFMETGGTSTRDLSERYLSELFAPDMTQSWEQRNAGRLAAEGHNRLAAPLYILAFALIAFAAIACSPFSRRGYAARIILAMAAAIGVRVLGFAAQGLAAATPALNAAQYLVPLAAIAVALAIIAGWSPRETWRALRPRLAGQTEGGPSP